MGQSGKWFIECSHCHRMVGMICAKKPDEMYARTFTCSSCSVAIKGKP